MKKKYELLCGAGGNPALRGTASIQGCEQASILALSIAAQAVGTSEIHSIPNSATIAGVIASLRAMGSYITYAEKKGTVLVEGVGVGGLVESCTSSIPCSDTMSACVMMGILATSPNVTFLEDDVVHSSEGSYTKNSTYDIQDLGRILRAIGVQFLHNGGLPMAITGIEDAPPICVDEVITSATVKFATLIASINIQGVNSVLASRALPTYAEGLLRHFDAEITVEAKDGIDVITVVGQKEMFAKVVYSPPDTSYVIYVAAMALIARGSAITIPYVCLDKTLEVILHTFRKMGGKISFTCSSGFTYTISVEESCMMGVEIGYDELVYLVEELPIVCIVCAYAGGVTRFHGLSALQAHEKGKIIAVAEALTLCGVAVEVAEDMLEIRGCCRRVTGGCVVDARGDTKIAISFSILGLCAHCPIAICGEASFWERNFTGALNAFREEEDFFWSS